MNTCSHGDRPLRCGICALMELRQAVDRIHIAVTDPRAVTGGSDFVRGGAPSWEPINLAALSLLQDIRAAGGLTLVEATMRSTVAPESAAVAVRQVVGWRNRAHLILGTALAAYALLWPDNTAVLCPVIDEHGECAAPLKVHREQDPDHPSYGRPALVQCARDHDHNWPLAYGGWLRLGVLLGGVA
jgi:hypothetical protein